MTEQVKQLDEQIISLERAIVERTAQLKVAQERWEDWKAGTLRAAIGRDQVDLHNLRIRRSSCENWPAIAIYNLFADILRVALASSAASSPASRTLRHSDTAAAVNRDTRGRQLRRPTSLWIVLSA
jgi:hypothetical protein